MPQWGILIFCTAASTDVLVLVPVDRTGVLRKPFIAASSGLAVRAERGAEAGREVGPAMRRYRSGRALVALPEDACPAEMSKTG